MKKYFCVIFCGAMIVSDASSVDTTNEEKTCVEIGFHPKTESFGNCVLKLLERKLPGDALQKQVDPRIKHQENGSAQYLNEIRRLQSELDYQRHLDRERIRRSEEASSQERMWKHHQDFNEKMMRDNRRSMCESWGNQYCY